MDQARGFGPGVDVYVAASSTDPFTWRGGETPGSRGNFMNGLGVDPAMDFFGAQRITAEFPLTEMTSTGDYDIHNFYYKFIDKSTGQRNESLANFGRIAAARSDRVELEGHRTVDTRPDRTTRIHDPAAQRPAQIEHPGLAGADRADNCAHGVADMLSARYAREVRIEAASAPTGVAARGLFEAVGSGARFASYTEVAERLRQLGSGSSAVLASRWTGARYGGHAYLAVNDGGEIYLMEPRTGRRSGWPPHWGEHAVSRTAVGYLDEQGNPIAPLHDVPLQLAAADAIGDVQGIDPSMGGSPDPDSILGLTNYEPGRLSDAEVRAVYTDGELRMREHNERLIREGVSAEDRARMLSDLRDVLRARTRDLMSNRVVAEFLATYETSPTFEELITHNEAKGLFGDAVYEAIIDTATHSHYAPGTLSDIETTDLYSQFELQMRAYHEQLIRDGVSVEQRARILSDLRNALRDWTRDLMSNRVVAEFLAAYEGRPSFQDLVAHNEARGLVGDAVYEAIIQTATHSHYARGTLTDAETRTVYTTFELRMREVHEHLLRRGADPEERARTLYGMRAALRSWTRALMADRELAEWLNENEPNPAFEALVERQRQKGREGVAIYEAIIASATRSRASVNESLGIDPDNPPPLPPMRGATDGGDEEVASTTWYSSRNDRPDGIRDLIARIKGAGVDADTTAQVERAVLNRYQGNLQLRQTQLRQEFLNNKTAELVNKGTPTDAAEATARQQVDDYLGSERAQHLIARDAVARTIEWTDKIQLTQVLHDIATAPGSKPSIFDDIAERFAARGPSSAIDQLPKALKSTLTRIDNAGADPAVTEQAKSLIHDRYQEYLQAPTENVYRDVLVEKRAGFARDGFPPAVADRLAERETVAFTQTPKARRMIDSVAANNTNQWFEKARVSAERDGVNLADRLAETYRHEQQPLSETELRAVGDRLTAMRDHLGAVEHRLNTMLEQSPDLVAKGADRWLAGIATQLDVLNRLSTAMENRIAAGEPITRRTMSDAVLHGPEANIRGYEGEIRLAEQFDNIHALGPLVDTDAPTGVRMASEVDVVTDEGRVWHESKTNDIDSQRGEQKRLEAQARRQLYISYLNPEYWVDDIPPQVKWHFMNGVHPTVKARLEAIRIEDETGHIVDNHHIEVIDHGGST
jgi:hypothetical protein